MKLVLAKETIDKRSYSSFAGMINIYECMRCGHSDLYVYGIPGNTPNVVRCEKCGGHSYSKLSAVKQPNKLWYRPDGLSELKLLAKAAFKIIKDNNPEAFPEQTDDEAKNEILNEYIDHYNQGGLFARRMQ